NVAGFFPQVTDHVVYRLVAVFPRDEVDHPHAVGGSRHFGYDAIAGKGGYRFNHVAAAGNVVDFVQHLFRAVYGGPRRGGHGHVDHSLVFGRDKTRGYNGAGSPGEDMFRLNKICPFFTCAPSSTWMPLRNPAKRERSSTLRCDWISAIYSL